MKIIIAVLCLGMVGCNKCEYVENQTKRQEIFFKCMKALPAGPQATKYNDWDEVVSECGSQAYYMSLEWVCKGEKK